MDHRAPMPRLATIPRLLSGAAILAACGDSTMPTPPTDATPILQAVAPSQWEALAQRRIFFAHMSVGGNMVDGITALLQEHPSLPVRLIRSSEPDTIAGGAIFHNFVGENGDPSGKTADFARIVESGTVNRIEIGVQKYCFADFPLGTEPESVFADYERGVEALRRARPDLQIVHVTAPVTAERFSLKDIARRLLGRQTARAQLDKVRRYNALLLARYGGVDPIFDLAGAETGVPATPATSQSLNPAYATADGAHLNEVGQRVVGAQFLVFLATLPPTPTAP